MMRSRSGNMVNQRWSTRPALLAFALVIAMLLVTGCSVGDDDGGARQAPRTATTTTTGGARPVDTQGGNDDDAPTERTPQQAREAIATGRALDQIAAVFAPVSARINFLVAADTLRRDAIATEADDAIILERAGAVRLEARRMRPLLVTARRELGARVVQQPDVRRVQAALVAAIAARMRALDRLEAVLDAESDELADGDVADLDDEFRIAWDESVRATRDATGAVQDIRAGIGLDPAPEEALR